MLSTLVKLPAGTVTVRLESTGSIEEAILGDSQRALTTATQPAELHRVELSVESKGDPLFLLFRVQTGRDRRPFQLKARYQSAGEKTHNTLTRDQMFVPSAPLPAAATATRPCWFPTYPAATRSRPVAVHRQNARCSQCHTYRGQGGKVGPDLTEIGRKGAAEIYRNIAAPAPRSSPTIPEYTVGSKDGHVVVGVVRASISTQSG